MSSNVRAIRLSVTFLSSLFLGFSTYSSNAIAATFTVNSTVDAIDTTPGDGVCSAQVGVNQTACTLRAAIMETNALVGADTVMIPSGTYLLSLGTVNEDAAKEGDLDILDDVVIVGDAVPSPVIDGMSLDRVFDVRGVGVKVLIVEMTNLNIINGNRRLGVGGGIANSGVLTLRNVVLSANAAEFGGGIANYTVNHAATLYLIGVTLQGNSATFEGGGMYATGDAIFLDSTITGNTSEYGAGILGSYGESAYGLYMVGGSIDHNTTTNSGAGAYVRGGVSYFDGVVIDHNINNASVVGSGAGGGIYSDASLHLNRVTITNNTATSGGGLYGSAAEIVDSVFSGNSATSVGGGMYGYAPSTPAGAIRNSLMVRNSLFTGNTANLNGGGICATGELRLENVTISGNTATSTSASYGKGGGIYYSGSNYGELGALSLVNATVIGNASTSTGNNLHNASGTVKVGNSIIAGGATSNCAGIIDTLGYNIDSGKTCNFLVGTDKSNTDPLLDALADNGGVTMTHALLTNSPAIDGALSRNCPEFDQRHFVRNGKTCDIGAYEYKGAAAQAGTLQLELVDYSVAENIGNAVLKVTRTGGKDGAITATWKTVDLMARSGSDYTAGTGTLTWANGDDLAKTITIPIIDDAIFEPTEKFNVYLLNATNGAQTGANKTAAVSILDNDWHPGTLQFSSAVYSGNENASDVTITVTRTGGSNGVVTVGYATANGTATAGQDYTAATGTITFADGDAAAKTFKISITDDAVYEGNETTNVGLSNVTGGATLGTAAATLTIIDNEVAKPGTFTLDQATYSVAEGAGKLTFTVNRTSGTDTTVVVPYTVSPGTALSPSDYTGTLSGTLSFAPGETSHTFDVTIIDDAVVESSETFTVKVAVPAGGAVLGTPASATVTITDNDVGVPKPGTFAFSTAAYSVAEGAGTITVTVNRGDGTSGAVDVPYVVTAGTATQDADYSGTYSGTLSFAAGETSRTFDLNIVDDVVVEGAEAFTVAISNPTNGGVLGALSSAVVTITDNDSSVTPTSPVDAGTTTGGGSGGKSGGGGSLEPMFAFGLAFLFMARGVRRSRKIIH